MYVHALGVFEHMIVDKLPRLHWCNIGVLNDRLNSQTNGQAYTGHLWLHPISLHAYDADRPKKPCGQYDVIYRLMELHETVTLYLSEAISNLY